MKAEEICQQAAKLVGGDRAAQHGDKTKNHQNIADLWTAYLSDSLSTEIKAEDVANMMELLKIARRKTGSFNPDDYVDGAGYAAVAGEIRALAERSK